MKFTSRRFFWFGVPQGFSPPEKLGKLRQTIDLMLCIKREEGFQKHIRCCFRSKQIHKE